MNNPGSRQRIQVLIVEDDLIISLMIERMVERIGHEVIKNVTSGEEAVETALKYQPDIILMDIRLDGRLNGIEAMAEIRKKINIPVLYITGNTDQAHLKQIHATEFLGVLKKPISYTDLDNSLSFVSDPVFH